MNPFVHNSSLCPHGYSRYQLANGHCEGCNVKTFLGVPINLVEYNITVKDNSYLSDAVTFEIVNPAGETQTEIHTTGDSN